MNTPHLMIPLPSFVKHGSTSKSAIIKWNGRLMAHRRSCAKNVSTSNGAIIKWIPRKWSVGWAAGFFV